MAGENLETWLMDDAHLTTSPWPNWLEPLLGLTAETAAPPNEEVSRFPMTVARHGDVGFVSLTIREARQLEAEAFHEQVAEAYATLPAVIERSMKLQPVRFWNFVPGLHRETPDGGDWYMLFNSARRDGLARWLSGDGFEQRLPTASAIDTHREDLVIHVLAAAGPSRPMENPRQVSAYCYSRQFGQTPPSFARATALPDATPEALKGAVLIGGTASIVGETSRHLGDTDAQLDETLRNIAHLLGQTNTTLSDAAQTRLLAMVRALRVYVVEPGDQPRVTDRLRQACPRLAYLEVLTAELCRPELRVEVEGLTEPGVVSSEPVKTGQAAGSFAATAPQAQGMGGN